MIDIFLLPISYWDKSQGVFPGLAAGWSEESGSRWEELRGRTGDISAWVSPVSTIQQQGHHVFRTS